MDNYLKSIIFTATILSAAPAFASPAPGFLAYGDLRGHIEPCGCDPTTDLGGIKRLGIVLERERALRPDLALFNLGNELPPMKTDGVKVPFLFEADARLKPTAELLNVLEIRHLTTQRQKLPANLPFVLSNAKPKSSLASLAAPIIVDPNYAVLGYAFVKGDSNLVRVNASMLKSWQTLLAKSGAGKQAILLFSGSKADLEAIAAAKIFTEIVASNSSSFDTEPGTAERLDEGRLTVLTKPPVHMVPLGGQGLLRGGSLLFEEAKPLADYLKGSGETKPVLPLGDQTPAFQAAKLVTWMDPVSAPGDGPLSDVYSRYVEAARRAFIGGSEARLKNLQQTPFAGSKACASCHAEASAVYDASKHAHAMKDLVDKGKHEDGECVACHSVGAREKGGFVSLAASPQFANVQCENCHGPRLAHTLNPGAPAGKAQPSAKAVCVSCHNAQHSPKFDADAYWKIIAHH